MKMLFVVNSSDFFNSHFIKLAESVLDQGWTVYIAAGDDSQKLKFQAMGFNFFLLNLSRNSKNLFKEIKTIYSIYQVIKLVQPDILHMFTIKPIIYGCLVNKVLMKTKAPLSIASITGLGSASLSTSLKGKLLWSIIKRVYKFVLYFPTTHVVFENDDDKKIFVELEMVLENRAHIVNGAGVNTSVFFPLADKSSSITIVLVARLLKDKGIREYIQAGKILKEMRINVVLKLVGSVDKNNISSMAQKDIDDAHSLGYIEYLGERKDIANIYQKAHIACLPSYREGLPKSLIEAAACGLPIVTTDVPGCRQIIHGGRNGILIPAKDSFALAMAIKQLAFDTEAMTQMGQNSREIAVSLYSHERIINSFFNIYKTSLSSES